MNPRFTFGRTLLAAAFCLVLIQTFSAIAQSPYHIIDRWKIGGTGGWDYNLVDPSAHKLYLSHGTRVEVVDTTTGKPVAAIIGMHGSVHGIALDTAGKFGYISDGGGNQVIVFDRSTFATVATIPVGTNPDCIIYEPATRTIWTFNGKSKDASVIDEATRKVIATVPVPGKPEFVAVDSNGILYNNLEDKGQIIRIDANAKKVTDVWPVAGCESPTGLVLDQKTSRLFTVCDGNVMAVVDAKSGAELSKAAICDGPDAAGWDPTHNLAFASCGDGNLSVVDAGSKSYPTIETVKTQFRARTMTYDPIADRVYTVTADFTPAPAPTASEPKPRGSVIPDTFTVIVIGR